MTEARQARIARAAARIAPKNRHLAAWLRDLLPAPAGAIGNVADRRERRAHLAAEASCYVLAGAPRIVRPRGAA